MTDDEKKELLSNLQKAIGEKAIELMDQFERKIEEGKRPEEFKLEEVLIIAITSGDYEGRPATFSDYQYIQDGLNSPLGAMDLVRDSMLS